MRWARRPPDCRRDAPALRSYFPRFDGRARLHKSLHPGEHALPAFAVILGRFLVARESGMAKFDGGPHACSLGTPCLKVVHRAWLEFPSHHGVWKVAEGGRPSMNEQARRIDLEVFAVDAEGCSVRSNADARPLATGRRSALHSVIRYMPACPHQRGIWAGSVMALNTRSGGAATKISASMVSLPGLMATVAISILSNARRTF